MLLLPLENVKQVADVSPRRGCALPFAQVFELARDERPYDEACWRRCCTTSARGSTRPTTSARHWRRSRGSSPSARVPDRAPHGRARLPRSGTLGAQLRRELEASPDFEDLLLLRQLDDAGRVPGAVVGTVDEALDYLKELERSNEGW